MSSLNSQPGPLFFLCFLAWQLPRGVFTCTPADRSALSGFSDSLDAGIAAWPRGGSVNSSSDCCWWPGVHCRLFGASELRVVRLDLAGRGLAGGLHLQGGSLARLEKLSFLNLSFNSLHGPIPPELLLRMPRLRVLDLSHNSFTGELGDAAASDPGDSELVHLDVSFNSLSGLLDGVFRRLPRLRSFSAESNLLAGTVPHTLASCSELEYLNMENNTLHGALDLNFTRLPRLRDVHLSWNRLRGRIPASLSHCRDLRVVNLRRNFLSGPVPSALRRLQSLAFLNIGNNSITGIARALRVLQDCRALSVLILTMNFHGEEMPADGNGGDAGGVRGFPRLQLLGIAGCELRGAVPPWLRASAHLTVLDLSWNRLTGTVPPWLGGFDALYRIDLSGNALTGDIPLSLTRLKSLAAGDDMTASQQKLRLSDYGVRLYNWHVDRGELWYDGNIPPSLDLSQNDLAGAIPPEIGDMRQLNILNLSCNALSGPIPATLASLASLQALDLSHNELAGEIPASLTGLTFLSSFDVAYNRLRGVIPNVSQFSTFPCSSFAGNPGLHGEYCDGDALGPPAGTGATGWWSYNTAGEIFGLPFVLGLANGLVVTVLFAYVAVSKGFAG
uniref:Leucine-rich repeat-containing N-terminal plant-type domain-containing protein n=1 Tax=Oryza punctata TaxID=4537 RepID=A0A0E0MLT1_ORYPU